ncbi:hypothetical protein CYMTET_8253 [Cymbomonas tetramitiformis]|uniref:Alanine transaminase n=1 Tax=Cymbomonas tetramitiformis TaxID=36881 RepID=A0AAE0GTV7_9CHLO|nr:hypothetical protein CYMTET_8253 [Cymbomonas tetramitiformis]
MGGVLQSMRIEGAMYAFPRISLPAKYITHAEECMGRKPDTLYCMDVLRQTGVLLVPGNGFAQQADTFHFRMTILPAMDDLRTLLAGLCCFQKQLYADFGDATGLEVDTI